jgi:hypothetical protein
MRVNPIHAVSLLLLFLTVTACNIQVGDTTADAPPKPGNVPAQAVWSGGPDGGVFLLVSKTDGQAAGVYQGQIYHDRTGELEYDGKLKLNDNSRPEPDWSDASSYAGWDGSRLYLSDGRFLTAVALAEKESH